MLTAPDRGRRVVGHVGGAAVGFWGRRGRPPFLTRTLQRLGARRHAQWYADNLDDAIGEPLVDVARQRFRTELREDPEKALDPHTFDELERYFAARRGAG